MAEAPKAARSVSEILEDMEQEDKQKSAENGGNVLDNVGSAIKTSVRKKGKAAVQKVSDVAVDKAGDMAVNAALSAVTGGAVNADDFKGTNSRKGIASKIFGVAATAVAGTAVKSVAGDLIDAIKGDGGEKSEAKESKLEVPPTTNLDAQASIAAQNRQNGRNTKMMQYTDKQLESLNDTDRMKLATREAFVANPVGTVFQAIKADNLSSIYGALAMTSKQVPVKRKTLPEKDMSDDLFFDDSNFADLFTSVTSETPSKADDQPEIVPTAPETPDVPTVDPEAEKAARLEAAKRQAALAEAAFNIKEEQPEMDSPGFGRF